MIRLQQVAPEAERSEPPGPVVTIPAALLGDALADFARSAGDVTMLGRHDDETSPRAGSRRAPPRTPLPSPESPPMHSSQIELDPSVEAALAAHAPPHVAIVSSTEFRRFHNALRVLLNIDASDLVEAGVIEDQVEWRRFADNPFLWFIRADDRRAAAVWQLIEGCQPVLLRVDQSLADTRYAAAAE